jgi:hypothetical protein
MKPGIYFRVKYSSQFAKHIRNIDIIIEKQYEARTTGTKALIKEVSH